MGIALYAKENHTHYLATSITIRPSLYISSNNGFSTAILFTIKQETEKADMNDAFLSPENSQS